MGEKSLVSEINQETKGIFIKGVNKQQEAVFIEHLLCVSCLTSHLMLFNNAKSCLLVSLLPICR